MKTKLNAYCRVSTKEQDKEDKQGLELQLNGCNNYFDREYPDGWICCVYNEQISGAKLHKPMLEMAFEDCKANGISKIHTYGDDRFSRDLLVKLVTKKRFQEEGISHIDVLMPLGEEIEDEYMSNIWGATSQFIKQKLSKTMHAGRKVKNKKGGYAGGRPPFGYTGLAGRIVHNEKYDIVIKIRELHDNGYNYSAIASELNGKGLTTNSGKAFYPQTVKNVLTSNISQGLVQYGGVRVSLVQ